MMRTYLTLARRELAGYFISMTGYVIIAAALFLMGLSFVVLIEKLHQEPTPMPVTELFFITPFFWLIVLLAAPVSTMRLFAHEKFSGTFETLMTAPVSDLQVVLAKFTAAFLFWFILWMPLLGCLLVTRHYTNSTAVFDAGAVAGAFLGVMLIGALFLSLGCCASAMTKNQVTAAMISLMFGASLFLVGVLADKIPVTADWQGRVLSSLAFFEQMHDFARGVVDTRPIALYLSLTMFFLFLTLRVVESRRWK
jgi:ABC-2 type transport system permease protein